MLRVLEWRPYGFFRAPSSEHSIHVLHPGNSKRFHSPLHSAKIISSSDYRHRMSPTRTHSFGTTRGDVASVPFHAFWTVSTSNPRPTHFDNFAELPRRPQGGIPRNLLFLRSWLSFGFGSARRYNLGEQGVQTISSPSLIELGTRIPPTLRLGKS